MIHSGFDGVASVSTTFLNYLLEVKASGPQRVV